ncbi:PPOX class F420-dependent oxidoreductase [Streptomyces sp. SID8352]|uniref:PPOX class F420-dependent oxidoreductase n=1 Tax=Streptomyces sp. SID8352 TaxID=2690338 RepID=UPI0019293064
MPTARPPRADGAALHTAANTLVRQDESPDSVRPRHHAVLLTRRSGHGPRGSPLTCGVDDAGRVVAATCPERAETCDAHRDERVAPVVLGDGRNGLRVRIDGTAETVDAPGPFRPPAEYCRAVAGERPDRDDCRRALVERGSSLIRIAPGRRGPVATGASRRGRRGGTDGAGRGRLLSGGGSSLGGDSSPRAAPRPVRVLA